MQVNEGTVDRVIRVVAGILILALLGFVDGPARWLALVGLVPLVTGIVGTCPIYTMLGMNTCPTKKV